MEKLLIIEDSEEIRNQLKWGLGKQYSLLLAADGKEAIALFKKYQPKVVTLDLGMPPDESGTAEGFKCLDEILKTLSSAKVIVITGNNDKENALKAIQRGAYDYYQKPLDLEELKVIISRAFYLYQIEKANRKLLQDIERKSTVMGGMIGQCPKMMDVFSVVRKIAPADVSVLIQGESGTGKELVAMAMHSMNLRKNAAFVTINCSAIPENLLESELFGHEKGAFTGAHVQVQGKIEYAHNGTLFLDEIGELPAHLQVKLLRFLQEKCFQRVGGREDIHIDARIISATNIDISKAIQEGKFREDLYYRISVVTINLPPLRERKEDIMLLSSFFLARFADELRKKVRGFSESSVDLLESYEWPGNVRELENKIKRAVIMSESRMIEPRDLGFTESPSKGDIHFREGVTLKEKIDGVEREMIISIISKHSGNVAKSAEDLGISRPTLYDLMKKHGLYNVSDKN